MVQKTLDMFLKWILQKKRMWFRMHRCLSFLWVLAIIIVTTVFIYVPVIYMTRDPPDIEEHISASPLQIANRVERLLTPEEKEIRFVSTGRPVQHVFYLKTHKTGSTTVFSILAEYCRSNKLRPLLPVGHHINVYNPFRSSNLLLHPKIKKYDMVFNHHIYSPYILPYLHNDTFLFTTLREPFKHFVSSFYFFRNTGAILYLNNLPDSDPFNALLTNPEKYEPPGYVSLTNNRQSVDLGYDLGYGFTDVDYIRTFIALVEKRFNLVLISDFFDESLVLLKRRLSWDTQDILYTRKLQTDSTTRHNFTKLQRQQHRQFSLPDIELYEHFLKIFKETLSQEHDLEGEVNEFREIMERVSVFCDKQNSKEDRLVIPRGKWSGPINIDKIKCSWLKLDEVSFTEHLKKVQRKLKTV